MSGNAEILFFTGRPRPKERFVYVVQVGFKLDSGVTGVGRRPLQTLVRAGQGASSDS